MQTTVFNVSFFRLTVLALLAASPSVFAPVATAENPQASSAEDNPTQAAQDVPDDQLALPITLAQFQNLQTFVQKHTETTAKAIDEMTKNAEDFTKDFNAFVDDLLKEPTDAGA